MATKKVTEYETVEKEREVKICDYCRMVSSEDIEDNEEFKQASLNLEIRVSEYATKRVVERVTKLIKEDAERILNEVKNSDLDLEDCDVHPTFGTYDIQEAIQQALTTKQVEETADLCPNCADQLFGDGPVSMVRQGTGMMEE